MNDTDPRSWPVARLKAAETAYSRRGARTPDVVLGHREYHRRWAAARRHGQTWPPGHQPTETRREAFLTDVGEMADQGETLAGVAMRLGASETAVRRRLERCQTPGQELLTRLVGNAQDGHVRQGAIRRGAA